MATSLSASPGVNHHAVPSGQTRTATCWHCQQAAFFLRWEGVSSRLAPAVWAILRLPDTDVVKEAFRVVLYKVP